MVDRINDFYAYSSIYRPNKFLVGFYGEYVYQAIKKMESDSKTMRSANNRYNGKVKEFTENYKQDLGTDIYNQALTRWKENHYFESDMQVELKWTCSNVTLPGIHSKIESKMMVDSIKSIEYPLVTGYGGVQQVSLEIIEDRNLMMYQFFNALMNRFFTPQILKPRSSMHKLGMYVAVLQEDLVIPQGVQENGTSRHRDINAVVSHIFEYNSIVIKGIPNLKFSNDSKNILKYEIQFDVPNAFQGSFKTSLKGLRDNTSDTAFDANYMQKDGLDYNRNQFEITEPLTISNGVYEKTLNAE